MRSPVGRDTIPLGCTECPAGPLTQWVWTAARVRTVHSPLGTQLGPRNQDRAESQCRTIPGNTAQLCRSIPRPQHFHARPTDGIGTSRGPCIFMRGHMTGSLHLHAGPLHLTRSSAFPRSPCLFRRDLDQPRTPPTQMGRNPNASNMKPVP